MVRSGWEMWYVSLITHVSKQTSNFFAQGKGDLWYFPAGNPHSIQAKDTSPEGAEFLLIFDNGLFSEDSTFSLTDWLAHVPKSVIAKNFGLPNDLEKFNHIPAKELYIFPCKYLPYTS